MWIYISKANRPSSTTQSRWNKYLPSKVNISSWRIKKQRLPTRLNLDKRGVDLHSVRCPICDDDLESENHIFVECIVAKDTWSAILTQLNWQTEPLLITSTSVSVVKTVVGALLDALDLFLGFLGGGGGGIGSVVMVARIKEERLSRKDDKVRFEEKDLKEEFDGDDYVEEAKRLGFRDQKGIKYIERCLFSLESCFH
ncbi:RNA-directed DNA polymerase, eukaryota, reverse transcriptase zinc-binding domain protein [Tanacetum coccineum]